MESALIDLLSSRLTWWAQWVAGPSGSSPPTLIKGRRAGIGPSSSRPWPQRNRPGSPLTFRSAHTGGAVGADVAAVVFGHVAGDAVIVHGSLRVVLRRVAGVVVLLVALFLVLTGVFGVVDVVRGGGSGVGVVSFIFLGAVLLLQFARILLRRRGPVDLLGSGSASPDPVGAVVTAQQSGPVSPPRPEASCLQKLPDDMQISADDHRSPQGTGNPGRRSCEGRSLADGKGENESGVPIGYDGRDDRPAIPSHRLATTTVVTAGPITLPKQPTQRRQRRDQRPRGCADYGAAPKSTSPTSNIGKWSCSRAAGSGQ